MKVDDAGRCLSPEALHAFMQRLDTSRRGLALIMGVRTETLADWLTGKREIPMWVHPFLEMMTVPKARQLAERIVDDARFRTREGDVRA